MSNIKHTKAKSCFIPSNSLTHKRRCFAVVNFETNQDLMQALHNSIVMDGRKLSWKTVQNKDEDDTSISSMSTSSETFYSNKEKEQTPNKIFRRNSWADVRKQTSFNTDQKASHSKVMEWISDNLDDEDEITDSSHSQNYNITKPRRKNKKANGEEKEKTTSTNNPAKPIELLLQQIGKICDRLAELEQRTRLQEGVIQDPPNQS